MNRGKLCPKGLSEHYTIDALNRARHPLLRKNGKLVPVDWEEALETLVERFRAVQQKHGKNALGVLSTGQLVTEEFYALGKLVQLGFGTNNYDGNTTLCMASAVSGYKVSFGSDGPPGAYEDLEKADVVLLIGANIADNHPILCQYLDTNPRRMLIVADPRVSKTAMMADLHLPLKPRTDLALLNGLAHIMVRHGLVDRAYIERHTSGFAELEQFLQQYTPDKVSAITGLSEELLYKTATLYARANAGFIGWTMGVNHSTQGTQTVNAICNLALLTGQIGRAGASPFSITGQCNAMGTRETGCTSSLPGYRKFDNPADRAEIAALWNIDEQRLPRARGLAYPDIIEGAVGRSIRGLWIIATNPLVSFPNQGVLRQALSNLEFLVVQDGYHPTPTTELARPGAACRHLGGKGRHLYQFRTPRQQSQQGGRAAGRSAVRLRHLSGCRRKARLPRGIVPGMAHPARRLRRMAPRLARTLVRLLRYHLRPVGARDLCAVAVSGGLDRSKHIRASTPMGNFKPPTAARAWCAPHGSHSPNSLTAIIPWCSIPAARWSTGTRAPRRARFLFWSASRPTPGWK